MQAADALEKLRSARVARLATLRPNGFPHLIPIVFALACQGLVTAIDGKPKSHPLPARIRNINQHPRVCVLVDEYQEDWSLLWWVRVDGTAMIHRSGPIYEQGTQALRDRYPQYRTVPIPGPVIYVDMERVTGWSAG